MIKRALISVSDKTGLTELARFLAEQKVEILSTGGTARALREAGIAVTEVSAHTGFPEIMDGRVKTLHPKIHGGLLGVRGNKDHEQAMREHGIAPIDLVVINLYPFEATVEKGAGFAECIENIDIGGPSMVRSSAKNHESVTIVVDPADYAQVITEMKANKNTTAKETRRRLAAKAFSRTAAYDSAISQWFNAQNGVAFPPALTVAGSLRQPLHYGENPHQKAAFYATGASRPSLATATQHQGKELSYNNINDTDAAWELVCEFDRPAVAIIKHANPCGVATTGSLHEAYLRAYACDKTSAFGGIVALNGTLDGKTAEEIGKLFVEVIIAPDVSDEAKAVLAKKTKLRLLTTGGRADPTQAETVIKSVGGGFLVQTRDNIVLDEATLTYPTAKKPTAPQMQDLRMALTIAKHVKSNAIVLVRDGATVGIGAGQMSRIDSTKIACMKAAEAGLATQGAALASEAFFPFADNVEMAAAAGITAIIQPGGSIRDKEVIEAADKAGIAMIFTGIRHFRH
jgi:phosphoribosylaminoimidazolecarboxamide formyltransferase / IMP cyclohydrolase